MKKTKKAPKGVVKKTVSLRQELLTYANSQSIQFDGRKNLSGYIARLIAADRAGHALNS